MKALSLWQPWASLVVHSIKRIETRGRIFNHRGPLLIHAAKHWSIEQFSAMATGPLNNACQAINQHLRSMKNFSDWRAVPEQYGLPMGAIVGVVDVLDCRPMAELTLADIGRDPVAFYSEQDLGDYTLGRYAIRLAKAAAFSAPIPWKGKQGMFDVKVENHMSTIGSMLLAAGRDSLGIGIATAPADS